VQNLCALCVNEKWLLHRAHRGEGTEVHRVLLFNIIRQMEIDELTEIVIGCAIEVHRNLGPGLLESAYKECLFYELRTQGIDVEREINLPIIYKD
jgi:PD-(D/E)XK nuclease superfamily